MGNAAQDDRKYQLNECFSVIDSFIYFINSYCWIEAKDTSEAIPFKLWPEQARIIPDIIKNLLVIILKARQLGLTWLVAAYCLWVAITKPLQLIVIMSSKEDTAKEFLARVKFILVRLPEWLYPAVARETTEEIEFSHTDNSGHPINSLIKSLPTTKSGAQSKTPTILVIDEAHESRDVGRLYAASKPGIEVAGGQVIVIANSVKDTGGWPWVRGIFINAMKGLNNFTHIFLPWRAHPGRSQDIVTDPQTKNKIVKFKLDQIRGGMDEEDFSQHYPESETEAISLMGGSYFGRALKRHGNDVMPGMKGRLEWDRDGNVHFIQDRQGLWEFWKFPYRFHPDWKEGYDPHWLDRYCIGADLGQGLGQDYSVAYIMDRTGQDMIARCRSNRLDEDEYGHELLKAAYFFKDPDQPALICPARRGATTAIKRLEKGIPSATPPIPGTQNLYVRQIADVTGHGMTHQIGFMETEESKKELCGDFRVYLRTTRAGVYDSILIDEASTYIRHDNGRLGAEEGHHDDCVVAGACCVQGDKWIESPPKQVVPDMRPYWLKRAEGDA